MEQQNKVIELVEDKDGIFKEVSQCSEEVKIKEKAKPKSPKVPKTQAQIMVMNNPMYQFLDGAEVGMEIIDRAMNIFGGNRGGRR